jgi:hypothetical protein
MNDDGEEKGNGEEEAADFAQEGEGAGEGGELTWVSEECPPEIAAQFWLSVAAYEEPPYDRDRHLPRAHGAAMPDESDELM